MQKNLKKNRSYPKARFSPAFERLVFGFVLVLATLTTSQARAQHEGDIIVARSAGGQLRMADPDVVDEVVLLSDVNGPFLFGWQGDEPGFDHLKIEEPMNDLFVLQPGAQISVEAISISPAFKIWGEGFATVIDEVGEQVLLGDDQLHEHLTFHIDAQDSSFEPAQQTWNATLRFIDTGATGYQPSSPFTMTFTNRLSVAPAITPLGVCTLVVFVLGAGATIVWRRSPRGTRGVQ